MIDESLLGDLLLTFSHKEDDRMVHVLLPIFKTENSNLNGSEILKLVRGIAEGNTKNQKMKILEKKVKVINQIC